MNLESVKEDDAVVVTWLDHFQYDNRFGAKSLNDESDDRITAHATTSFIGLVSKITNKWLVLSQNWPEEDPTQDGGMVILKVCIISVEKLGN